MVRCQIIAAFLMCFVTHSLGSSDDRFIKKYAMMKIYESCFGPEVVKQIRKEMKEAYAKCSSAPSFDETPNQQPNQQANIPSILLGKLPPGFAMDTGSQTIIKPHDGSLHNLDNELPNQEPGSLQPQKMSPMGGILAFRPQAPMQPQQPYPQQAIPPFMMNNPQLRFGSPNPFYQYNPYAATGMVYPQYNPYAYQQQQGYFQQPYYGNSRMSRDMDFRDRLELVSRGPGAGRVRNITCVMQELGYIDYNLEPNYEQITQRIANLPVSTELKGDIQDGLQFCQKFAQCVPDVKRDISPLSQELIKPMFFFRCYKHKKLEACIMKDIRERFTTEDELDTDADFRSLPLSRSARSVQEPMHDARFEALDEMAVYLYDFLSGGTTLDFDLYM